MEMLSVNKIFKWDSTNFNEDRLNKLYKCFMNAKIKCQWITTILCQNYKKNYFPLSCFKFLTITILDILDLGIVIKLEKQSKKQNWSRNHNMIKRKKYINNYIYEPHNRI